MQEVYSEQIAKEIVDKFHEKGWNFYLKDMIRSGEERIMENLVDNLEMNVPYDLLPVANNPNDPEQIFDALEVLAQKLHRNLPTINFCYTTSHPAGTIVTEDSQPIMGVKLRERDVKIIGSGEYVSYPLFLSALDSIVDTTK